MLPSLYVLTSFIVSRVYCRLASMASYQVVIALFFTLAVASVDLSASHVLKASVACLDCDHGYDLSGIKVLVKCSQVKKLAMATTEADGSFETELPSDDTPLSSSSSSSSSPAAFNCHAKILGGPHQLYTSKKNIEYSNIVKVHAHGYYYYTTPKPLNFYKSCPLSNQSGNCGSKSSNDDDDDDDGDQFGSSKTVDLPLPREWGLPPTSYYLPFIPIIGIP